MRLYLELKGYGMRAIIIDDKDAANLLDLLKLERFEGRDAIRAGEDVPSGTRESMINEIHRRFHFIVCRWLQEQGANVVR